MDIVLSYLHNQEFHVDSDLEAAGQISCGENIQ